MTRIAAGSENMEVEDWMPSKIYLSVPLMWDILQFRSKTESEEVPTRGVLDASLTPRVAHEDMGESTTVEIMVATAPDITIDTADGGQQAHTSVSSAPNSSRNTFCDDKSVDQPDNLTFNTTPWLYADSSQFINIGDMEIHNSQPTMGEARGMPWWQDENFDNIMLNHV